jgi:hypothetical protein
VISLLNEYRFILVRQVYDCCCLQTSVFLPHWIKGVNGAFGALLTIWGKTDDVLTVPIAG